MFHISLLSSYNSVNGLQWHQLSVAIITQCLIKSTNWRQLNYTRVNSIRSTIRKYSGHCPLPKSFHKTPSYQIRYNHVMAWLCMSDFTHHLLLVFSYLLQIDGNKSTAHHQTKQCCWCTDGKRIQTVVPRLSVYLRYPPGHSQLCEHL